MAKETNTVYNVNAMRPAFARARGEGNRRLISKEICAELGISEGFFTSYLKGMEQLFDAVVTYCRLKNSPTVAEDALKTAREAVFPLWKNLLSCAEKDKFARELRVREDDVANLVSFCQGFVRDANDPSLGADKTFQARMAWHTQNFAAFRKKVETDLGIRIEGAEVMATPRATIPAPKAAF
jgi:AcrR family transcriptional regulator